MLNVQSRARIRVAKAEKKKREFAYKAEFIVTAFIRMAVIRNRLAARRLAECPILHTNQLLTALDGSKLLKSGREAVQMWRELWFISATRVQTAVQKWLKRVKYGRFFRGKIDDFPICIVIYLDLTRDKNT
jgi:hypothetical protein